MKNPIPTVKKIRPTSSSSLRTKKKEWQQPQMTQLNVQDTKGGPIKNTFEDPWSLIFGS